MPTGRGPNPRKAIPNPEQMTRKIKAFALYMGAGRVRVVKLDKRWVYSHAPAPAYGKSYDDEINYPYVICLAVPQSTYLVETHTGWAANMEVGWKYSYASFISFAMADYIKRLGYYARPSPTTNTLYMVPPLFVDCGIGEDGRCGYTITKEFGNNWRPGGIKRVHPGPFPPENGRSSEAIGNGMWTLISVTVTGLPLDAHVLFVKPCAPGAMPIIGCTDLCGRWPRGFLL
jgi:hypothetical protein